MALARSKLTAQGQISVPAEVRRRLGLRAGSVLEWEEDDGQIVVRKSGRHTLVDTRRSLGFANAPAPRKLSELREGIRARLRAKHARD